MESSVNPELEEQMKNIRWFYRTEDPSAWNYSILALSIVGLLLGIFILAGNIIANRKRKRNILYSPAAMDMKSTGVEPKQATVLLTAVNSSLRQDLVLDKDHEAKDGNNTSLNREDETDNV